MYEEKDEEGRYVLVRGMIEGSVFTLISVYIPPGSTFSFYKKIIELMITQSKGFLVCGGDLNIHLTPKLDISKQTGSNKAIYKAFKEDLISILRKTCNWVLENKSHPPGKKQLHLLFQRRPRTRMIVGHTGRFLYLT